MFLFEIELVLLAPLTLLVGLGLVGGGLACLRWYFAVPTLAVQALLAIISFADYFEPGIYQVALRQDPNYFRHLYVGVTVAVVLPIARAIFWLYRYDKAKSQQSLQD